MFAFRGICHATTSVAIFLFITRRLNANIPIFPTVVFIILGSLLPDIDHPFSTLGKYLAPINKVMTHRGITHTLAGLAFFTLPVLIMGNKLIIFGFVYGYVSHLAMDLLTPMGIKIWYPFDKKMYTLNVCRTGGITELALFCLSLQYIFLSF